MTGTASNRQLALPAENLAGSAAIVASHPPVADQATQVERLRHALRRSSDGMSARALFLATGIAAREIRSLLKRDLDSGRIQFIRNEHFPSGQYRICRDKDEELAKVLNQALQLLASNGYEVRKKGKRS